jgi:hypothetical protein
MPKVTVNWRFIVSLLCIIRFFKEIFYYIKFIFRRFFSLYDNKTSENNFLIDLKNVAKWLNVDIKSLRETLKKSYKKDIDYKDFTNKIQKKDQVDIHLKQRYYHQIALKKYVSLQNQKKVMKYVNILLKWKKLYSNIKII